jgi:hypothetical protein
MKLDNDKIDEAVLTLLLLGIHDGDRAWKGFDWESMNRLLLLADDALVSSGNVGR